MDAVTTQIPIKASYACPRCGTTNVERDEHMDKDAFEERAKSSPGNYWKEDKGGKTVYRHHEEGDEGKCRRSC